MDEKRNSNAEGESIDEERAEEEKATPHELQEINESRGDGGNPDWWKNDGGFGETH